MAERPTRIRYIVVAAAFLMSVLLYLDRFCISVAVVFMEEDLGLTVAQSAWIFSAFFWSYALGQVPSGWLTDRFGSRLMLTTYILAWSLFTGLVGFASSFLAIVLLRTVFGLAQAGAYPTAASIVRRWVPLSGRGTASGIVAVGGRIGASLAMFATGFLLIWFTPLSTPATLRPVDILEGFGPRICFNLNQLPTPPTPASRLQQRCFDELPNAVQELVRTEATRYARAKEAEEERAKEAGDDPKKVVVKLPLPREDTVLLAEGLSEVVRRRDFVSADDVRDLKIELEARRLVQEPRESLSDQQVQRLNRLVLESLHTGSLRRIYGTGWRPIMFLYGFLGVGVATIVWWSSRTSPREHPRCNAAEVALIEGPFAASTSAAPVQLGPLPVRRLVTDFSMWLCCVTQFFTNLGWFFLLTYMPKYLLNEHHVSLAEQAVMGMIVPIAGWVGMLVGGPATDFLIERWGLRWGRAWPIALSRFLAMGAYIVCLFSPSPWLAVAMFSIVAFGTDFGSPAVWAYCQDVGGRHVASILGWGNMWGNFGAAIGPLMLPWILGVNEDWNMAFVAFAIAFLLSGIAALGINATRLIVERDG